MKRSSKKIPGSEGLCLVPFANRSGAGCNPVPERKVSGSGYILLDALVGVGLLGLVIVSCLYLFSETMNRMSDITMKTRAAFLSQAKLEELKVSGSLGEEMTGDFGEAVSGFTWTAQSKKLENTGNYNLTWLKVVVSWQARGSYRDFSLETKFLQRK